MSFLVKIIYNNKTDGYYDILKKKTFKTVKDAEIYMDKYIEENYKTELIENPKNIISSRSNDETPFKFVDFCNGNTVDFILEKR